MLNVDFTCDFSLVCIFDGCVRILVYSSRVAVVLPDVFVVSSDVFVVLPGVFAVLPDVFVVLHGGSGFT